MSQTKLLSEAHRYVVEINPCVCVGRTTAFCSIVQILLTLAAACVNTHPVWSLMGWRESNQDFVHTWGPQLCGRTSKFPVFLSFPTVLGHKSHPNKSSLCLFS